LPALGQLVVDDSQHGGDRDGQGNGQPHAQPHRAQRVAALPAAQEGGDDPHDERRLETPAQGDHERVSTSTSGLG
jgi:hypothetical protein